MPETGLSAGSGMVSPMDAALSAIDQALEAKSLVVSRSGEIVEAVPDHNARMAACWDLLQAPADGE